jgi:CO dehydrogenase/acetyl-CoA synthase epsilon subunit
MRTQSEFKQELNPKEVAEHVARAHQLLKVVRSKIGENPELAEAILKLEMARNVLAVKTAGML